ncbi:Hypothetical predicted protein, partial [Paramuricea clavata]
MLLVWVIYLSYKIVLTGCEVILVNRNGLDSFRVGKDGCKLDTSVCTSPATCQSDKSCLCSDDEPNFRNPRTRAGDGKNYGCLDSESIRAGVGKTADCVLGPFQLIPHSQKEQATKFSDFGEPKIVIKNCSLPTNGKPVLVKFPDNATEMELQWLDQSYVDLNVSNKVLYFKWKKSVPNLQGTIITFNLYCEVNDSRVNADIKLYQRKCLRAKVLGTWSADTVSVPSDPTVTSTEPKSSQITTKTISSVTVTTETTAEPKSIVSKKIFIALFSASLVANVVLGIIVGFLWKDRKRMQDKHLKITELETIDEQRSAATGDDINAYDEVVTESGMHNERIYDESLPSSRHSN